MHQLGDGHDRHADFGFTLNRLHLFEDFPDSMVSAAKSLAASASEMWITSLAIRRLYAPFIHPTFWQSVCVSWPLPNVRVLLSWQALSSPLV